MQPQIGQAVYNITEEEQPNGFISKVIWDTEEVLIQYHDTGNEEVLTFEDLEDMWTDRFGGCWMLT